MLFGTLWIINWLLLQIALGQSQVQGNTPGLGCANSTCDIKHPHHYSATNQLNFI